VLWFEGMTVHASKPNLVQLVCHQCEISLSLYLCSIAPFPIIPAELFQLVVQASHQCIFLSKVSVSDCPGVVTIRAHLSENSPGTPLPYDLKMPGFRQHRFSPFGRRSRRRPTNAPYRAAFNNGDITSFEVGGINPHGLKMDQEPIAPAFSHGPALRFCHFVRSGRV